MEINRGTRVSLNKVRRNYYFQGEHGINLREGVEETTIVPEDISETNLEMIRISASRGHINIGWAKELKPDVKYQRDDSKLLDKGVKKLIPFLEEIAKTRGKGDDAPVARLEKLLSLEQSGKKRKTVTEKIEDILSSMSGISSVVEEEKEEIKISIV